MVGNNKANAVERVLGFNKQAYEMESKHIAKLSGGQGGRGNVAQQYGAVYSIDEMDTDREAARQRVRERQSK